MRFARSSTSSYPKRNRKPTGVDFARLRLNGFKSFAEPSELFIEPGLTGIVGPNGCGKSNLIDGLRWVMGESSARQMRGREMDDVIFGGSANRAPRNMAEITLILQNVSRTRPVISDQDGLIALSRRLERNQGSVYSINGREVRARDVHLLFADEATGSRGTTLVSQGGVGSVIAAKPAQRRTILEDAAGISGLHSRRHEAELKLTAAETNLSRLMDILVTLDTQHQGFLRQARQATRYRRLGERIRRSTALLLYCRWRAAADALASAEAELEAANEVVDARTREAKEIAARQAQAAAVLPRMRAAESAAAAEVHRIELKRVAREAEARRLDESCRELTVFAAQIDGDISNERMLAEHAGKAVTRLEAERAKLGAEQEKAETAAEESAAECAAISESVTELAEWISAITAKLSGDDAKRSALVRQVDDLGKRIESLRQRATEIGAKKSEAAEVLSRRDVGHIVTGAARARVEAAARVKNALEERLAGEAAEVETRKSLQAAETDCARLEAEVTALRALLAESDSQGMAEQLKIAPGFETALAVALGDDLLASLDADQDVHWRDLGPLPGDPPALPGSVKALTTQVEAPEALARCLSQVGLVEGGEGPRLQDALGLGQRLVSKDGGLWRWDGFSVAPGTPTPAARRLRERNRLTAAMGDFEEAEARRQDARTAHGAAVEALRGAQGAEARVGEDMRQADDALHAARDAQARAATVAARTAGARARLDEAEKRIVADLAEAEARHTEVSETLQALGPDAADRGLNERLSTELTERRASFNARQGDLERLRQETASRRERIAVVDGDLRSSRERVAGAKDRLAAVAGRRAEITARIEEIKKRPAQLDEEMRAIVDELATAQVARQRAAQTIAEGETCLRERDLELRRAEETLAESREERVRCQGAREKASAACDEVARAVAERLEVTPEALAVLAEVEEHKQLPESHIVEARLARLVKERDGMGAVNLRAETEAGDLGRKLDAMRANRADLEAAISRLRTGIVSLNREGRERLLAAFDVINQHFGKLFARLFRGGQAHLSLVDSDDPFEAGLEIMASPPGKRLQVLSLLSGGEQALTALALIMAVFLTNPAPICVLDEVDAPLDDHNVARFCDVLEEITQGSATRFLVITHHRMTMARMHRLFGVTMLERGISKLVSVDLKHADQMRAAG